jgi:hypothetical protein
LAVQQAQRTQQQAFSWTMASLDAQQYAEALRKSLMEDLFNGEELDDNDSSDQQQSTLTLQGMDESSQAQQQVCLTSMQRMLRAN